MDLQGAPNINFHHCTLKKSELAKNWPSSGPRLSRISTYDICNLPHNSYCCFDSSLTSVVIRIQDPCSCVHIAHIRINTGSLIDGIFTW